METLLKGPVQPAYRQAIPFRTIFEEHVRRGKFEAAYLNNRDHISLKDATTRILKPAALTVENVLSKLGDKIAQHEDAYRGLATANMNIDKDTKITDDVLEEKTATCKKLDDELNEILHALSSSALCLSGGSIRSASFCMSVLQGLCRFSYNSTGNGVSLLPATGAGVITCKQGTVDNIGITTKVAERFGLTTADLFNLSITEVDGNRTRRALQKDRLPPEVPDSHLVLAVGAQLV